MSAKKTQRKPVGSISAGNPQSPIKNQPGDSRSPAGDGSPAKWSREAFESIVVAILLALLFRGFEAEAFIIPTGSMAPTLQGRHRDLRCPQCDYPFRVGAAQEADAGPVDEANCPICRFQLKVDQEEVNQRSFSGDRILVNKYIYQFSDPKRWDVIVFKYPGNAKQNYIKRLVGLPNETIRILGGDVYSKPNGASEFEILRKPAKKLPYTMHVVHDTRYTSRALTEVGWPTRWQDRGPQNQSTPWKVSEDRHEYSLESGDDVRWLGYRHLPPRGNEWREIRQGRLPESASRRVGQLITDHYEYNEQVYRFSSMHKTSGWHWVGDLAAEAVVNVTSSNGGKLLLRLVEGGLDHLFEIDVGSGLATVTIEDEQLAFASLDGETPPQQLTGETPIKGPGKYRLMWANVDDQLLLWVNRRLISFQAGGQPHSGQFNSPANLKPHFTAEDAGDLTPISIAGKNVSLTVSDLRVLRDVYYVASKHTSSGLNEYSQLYNDFDSVQMLFARPNEWSKTPLFDARRSVEFTLGPDEFFPMGDNSPASKDARLWGVDTMSYYLSEGISVDSCVNREMLIGKAFLVYWPHTWNPGNIKLPILPNLDRMGLIR